MLVLSFSPFYKMKLRKVVLVALFVVCGIALYMGLADLSLPNDKLIHFTAFFIITGLVYWTFDVSNTRTVMKLTFMSCTLCGSIGSEFLQSLLTTRQFDVFDILYNILGSALALGISVYLHKRLLEKRKQLRYEQLRGSIPHDDERDLGNGQELSKNDLSRFTSQEDITLKNVDPEPIDDLQVE